MAKGQRLSLSRIKKLQDRFPPVLCACACGEMFYPFDERGRPRRYIRDHQTRSLVLKRERPYPLSKTNKGFKMTAEQRRHLSDAHLGQTPWNKGTKGLMPVPWNKGCKGVYTVTLETRRRISNALAGSNSYLWKGGISRCARPQPMDWNTIRKTAYKRDSWRCQICGKPAGHKLQCHHIVPRRYGGSDELSNLATVCISCHKKHERRYGFSDYPWGLFVVVDTPYGYGS